MFYQASDLSPAQKPAAELLLDAPEDQESLSVQAFDAVRVSEERRREIAAQLRDLCAKVDRNLVPASSEEAEAIFSEGMRSSRPGYHTKR